MEYFNIKVDNNYIIAKGDSSVSTQIRDLLNLFKKLNSKDLIDGYSLQMGWCTYFLKKISTEILIVLTPDLVNNPIENKIDDLTLSMTILTQQIALLKLINMESKGLMCSCFDTIVVDKNIFKTENFYLERIGISESNSSGWFIGAVEGEIKNEDLLSIYAWQLVESKVNCIKCLFLPLEYLCVYQNNELISVSDEKDTELLKFGN